MFRKISIFALVAAAFAPALVMAGEERKLQQVPATYACPDQNCKAKEAALCIDNIDTRTGNTPGGVIDFDIGQFQIYDCSDPIATATPIGFGAFLCSEPEANNPFNTVLCQGQISLRSCPKANSKYTTYWDSLALNFWLADDTVPPPSGFTSIQSTVVTGTKGAWGKAENIVGVHVDPYTGANGYAGILYLTYKSQGWDPTCAYRKNKNYVHPNDWN
jgi:hypothetical protein